MRLNWRLAARVLGGLLLPLPLVLVVASIISSRHHPRTSEHARFSPVLSAEERLQLPTYHRKCLHSTDCEPPLGCLSDSLVQKHYCADSECETDAQCPDSFTCVPLPTLQGGPLVRYCIPSGVRMEGETCLPVPSHQGNACAQGLRCAEGWCGRPCQLDNPTSCPEGFFCADLIPGPTCRPTCEGRTCPEGQQCMHDEAGASVCAVVYGSDCQRVPCPQGKRCLSVFSTSSQVAVWMECSPECDEGLPACPAGRICDRGSCLKPCEPDGPDVCDPGFRCQRYLESQPWACRPDM
jgi:hypothetical protein